MSRQLVNCFAGSQHKLQERINGEWSCPHTYCAFSTVSLDALDEHVAGCIHPCALSGRAPTTTAAIAAAPTIIAAAVPAAAAAAAGPSQSVEAQSDDKPPRTRPEPRILRRTMAVAAAGYMVAAVVVASFLLYAVHQDYAAVVGAHFAAAAHQKSECAKKFTDNLCEVLTDYNRDRCRLDDACTRGLDPVVETFPILIDLLSKAWVKLITTFGALSLLVVTAASLAATAALFF
ncbi:hypothetical protein CF319_g4222 [Tilletia indica]|nr:hypothetical protein CF319_g4222 [Tilletia indica]